MKNLSINKLIVRGSDVISFLVLCNGFTSNYVDLKESAKLVDFTFNGLKTVPLSIEHEGFKKAGEQWQMEQWGTKSDAMNVKVIKKRNEAILFFDTMDSPPTEWMRTACKIFPDMILELHYQSGEGAGTYCNQRDRLVHVFKNEIVNKLLTVRAG